MKTFQTLDLYLSAFLAFRGLNPTLEITNNQKIVFAFPDSSSLRRSIADFNADVSVPVNSYATAIKIMRAKLLAIREKKEGQ